ncbi:hypothetical protein CSA80_03305 [Candidatus Saccharibacteria bacterium]|nr:MAG: hypothetical protein CSA80_03305 [Candidatus Saccharibacteria bacterium]
MIPLIRSEIRKITTVRSTYIIFGLSLLLVLLMNARAGLLHEYGLGAEYLAELIRSNAQGTSSLLGLIVLLQVTHEYRYNIVYYTLTLARKRFSVVLTKAIVASGVVLLGAIILQVAGLLSATLSVAAGGDTLGTQIIPWGDIVTRGSVYVWGAGMYALIIGLLVRYQVGAIVMYFVGVALAEQFLSLLLKSNAGYLPFRALEGTMASPFASGVFSPEKSMAIMLGWIIVAGAVAVFLFNRRDAN